MNTGVDCHALLQGTFPNQGSNLRLLLFLPWQMGSLPLASLGKPSYIHANNLIFACLHVYVNSYRFSNVEPNSSSVQLLSHVWLFATPWIIARQASLFITNSRGLLNPTHVHRVGDAIQLPCPLLSPSPLPSIFHSNRVFSNESVLCVRWPKYWSFRFSISPFNE